LVDRKEDKNSGFCKGFHRPVPQICSSCSDIRLKGHGQIYALPLATRTEAVRFELRSAFVTKETSTHSMNPFPEII